MVGAAYMYTFTDDEEGVVPTQLVMVVGVGDP